MDATLIALLSLMLLSIILPFIMYFVGNKKFKARLLKKALIRIIDDSGEELAEDVVDYTPGKGMVVWGKLAFPVEDKYIIRCRGTTLITVNASNGKMLDLRELGKTDRPINPYQLQTLLISLYAAARSGVVQLVESLSGRVNIALALEGITLLIIVMVMLTLNGFGGDLAAIKAATVKNVTANITKAY